MRSMLFSRLTAKSAALRAGAVFVLCTMIICAAGGALDALRSVPAGGTHPAAMTAAVTAASAGVGHPHPQPAR